jgi:hypothetical protein
MPAMSLGERTAKLHASSGVLCRWCLALERVRDDLRRAEQDSTALAHRILARLVRLFFEGLVLGLIALYEIDTVWHRAANALAAPRR